MDTALCIDFTAVMMCIKQVCDKHGSQPNVFIEGPEGGSFAGMMPLRGDKESGDKLRKIIARLVQVGRLCDCQRQEYDNNHATLMWKGRLGAAAFDFLERVFHPTSIRR